MEVREVTHGSICPTCGYHNERPTDRCLSCGTLLPGQPPAASGNTQSQRELIRAMFRELWLRREPGDRPRFRAGLLLGALVALPWPLMGFFTVQYFLHFSDDPAAGPIMDRYADKVSVVWHVEVALWLGLLALGLLLLLASRRTRPMGRGLLTMLLPAAGAGIALAIVVVVFASGFAILL